MRYTDDPAADWDAHCLDEEAYIRTLPFCADCGERILDEDCYEINGEAICNDCMEHYKRFTSDLVR